MPTNMSSAELRELSQQVKQTSLFSARTNLEIYLQKIKEMVQSLLQPRRVERDGKLVTEGHNLATARYELQKTLDALDYKPDPKLEGTIQDLRSDARVDLVVKTNVQIARGYGYYRQGMDEDALDMFPAWEFFRAEEREKERDWAFRWRLAGELTGDAIGKGWTMTPSGQMIALKTHKIWDLIGSSELFKDALDNPYPPFAFQSGMNVREVDRDTAEALKLLGVNEILKPVPAQFGRRQA